MSPTKLWNRNFTLLWIGQAQSVCGNILYLVALTYLVLNLTGSPKYTAITMAAGTIPYVLSPLVGVMIDRINIKPYLVVGDLIRGMIMMLICYLLWSNHLTVSVIIGSAFLTGLIGVIYRPTFGSILPRLVPNEDIARANALNTLSGQIANFAGFIFGGILVAYIGILYAILINGVTFVIMSILLGLIKFPEITENGNNASVVEDLKAGFVYLFSSIPLLKIPFIFSAMGVSYAVLEMLMPVKLKSVNYGAEGFGILFSVLLIGSICSSSWISKFGKYLDANIYTPIGLVAMGVSIGGIAFSPSLKVACVFAFIYGIGSSLVSISSVTFIQTNVEDRFRGRIFGLFGVIEQACMPIALLIIGGLTDFISTEIILYLTSLFLLIISFFWIFGFKAEKIR
ncbi:MFS transporter [Thermoactinomyces sp. DSM 45892]|uniref:MFS transporter n=1 Tax=Thermoactinomyces sp. DSM 45892 TaxID=1882753 RepID=UPI00089C9123|nr:MFS transporter [Thermoactinomyces sp. DSM 45892]SDX96995.1 Na+/melibiose symporter [Thermoactinomyces sp. DSM 45892]